MLRYYTTRLRALRSAVLVSILAGASGCSGEPHNTPAPTTSSIGGTYAIASTIGSGGTSTVAGGTSTSGQGGTGASSSTGTGGTRSTGTLVNPVPASKFFIGANFWNIDWEGSSDYFQSGVDFATATNPWLPQFLSDLAPYNVLRFMDWNLTNDSNNPQAVWSTRKQKTQAQSEPVAFEWQIDLCNRTKKDYWLNVPHEADSTYWTSLANLVHEQLDTSLRVYLEYSNEVWNGSFPQSKYAASQASTLGLSGSNAAASFYVYASVRLFEAFEAVFGKGSPRLVKVLSGQAAWTGPCDAHRTALADKQINPKGTQPDVYAVAPYFSGNSTDELSANLSTVTSWVSSSVTCAQAIGVPLISYEGGSDSYSAPNNGCSAIQVAPAMHDIYGSYLSGISGAGMTGPFMQYTHSGACWGLKAKTSDSVANAPKYKGVLDWLAAHP